MGTISVQYDACINIIIILFDKKKYIKTGLVYAFFIYISFSIIQNRAGTKVMLYRVEKYAVTFVLILLPRKGCNYSIGM